MSSEAITKNDLEAILETIGIVQSTETSSIAITNSNFEPYASDTAPILKKFGNVREFTACIKNKDVWDSSTEVTICNVGSSNAPDQRIVIVEQGSGNNKFIMLVEPNGQIKISRYEGAAGSTNWSYQTSVAAGAWLNLHATWIIG